MSNRIIFN